MGEAHIYQIGNRARVPGTKSGELITNSQRTQFVIDFDEKNTAPSEVVVIPHEHRKRSSTNIETATTRYEPPGYSVEFTRNERLRVLKVVTKENKEPDMVLKTEYYYEAFPDSSDGDYYDLIQTNIETKSGQALSETPVVIQVPETIEEQIALEIKQGLHDLTQGRWQSAIDIMAMCTDENRV